MGILVQKAEQRSKNGSFSPFLCMASSEIPDLYHLLQLHVFFSIYTHKHTHTHTTILRLSGFYPRLPGWISTRKIKPSSNSWDICKSAPHIRHVTMPAHHHSVFYRPDALPATQPTVSNHRRALLLHLPSMHLLSGFLLYQLPSM